MRTKEKAPEKRRSDRLMITLPLVLDGRDSKDRPFEHPAQTLTINRHGARIITAQPLRAGQTIAVTNLATRLKGRFRVVGPVSPATRRGGEWGIECLNPSEDIWRIQFPPAQPSDSNQSKALLECRECGATALERVSLVEVEVLETAGILPRHCENCERETRWGLKEEKARPAPASPAPGGGAENRRHRRSALQLPVRIRDYFGGTEVTRTENVSKGGFCFVSEKNHQIGAGLQVVLPYDPSTSNHIEIRARVVRRRPVEGTLRQIYGVRYDR
jgi:hypothetical protein